MSSFFQKIMFVDVGDKADPGTGQPVPGPIKAIGVGRMTTEKAITEKTEREQT